MTDFDGGGIDRAGLAVSDRRKYLRAVALLVLSSALIMSSIRLRADLIDAGRSGWIFVVPALCVLWLCAFVLPRSLRASVVAILVGLWVSFSLVRLLTRGIDTSGYLRGAISLYPALAAIVGVVVLLNILLLIGGTLNYNGFWVDSLNSDVERRFGHHPFLRLAFLEVGVLSFLIIPHRLGWKDDGASLTMTMWNNSNQKLMVRALVTLIVVEAIVVHIGLQLWLGELAAGIATMLSVYSLAALLGDSRAVRANPLAINDDTIEVRAGLRSRASIPLSSIEEVTDDPMALDCRESASLAVFGDPNIVIKLRKRIQVVDVVRTRHVDCVRIQVDEPSLLKSEIYKRISPR